MQMLQEMKSLAERKRELKSMNDDTKLYQFGRIFRGVRHLTKEEALALNTTEKDFFINRMQTINLIGVAPSTFHAIFQKRPNFPKVRMKKGKRNYYLKSEIDAFIKNMFKKD